MRGKIFKMNHWNNYILFKEKNKKNLYYIHHTYDELGNKNSEFLYFEVLVGGEPYFEKTDNLLQSFLAIEKAFNEGKIDNCLLSCVNEDYENIHFHFQTKTSPDVVEIQDVSNNFIYWKPKNNLFDFDTVNTKTNILYEICRQYFLNRPGRSTLKLVGEPSDFLKVTASQKENFSKFKPEIDDMLLWADKYLKARGLPKCFNQIEFKKIKRADGKYTHSSKTIKIKLDTMTDEKVLFSLFSHELGHSVQHLFLENKKMQKYFDRIISRIPQKDSYFRNYLSTPKEIFARSIQTDFIMFVYGEYAEESPRSFLPSHYSEDNVLSWFIDESELSTFLDCLLKPSDI